MKIEKRCIVCSKDFSVEMSEEQYKSTILQADIIISMLGPNEYLPTSAEFVAEGVCEDCMKHTLKQ